MAADMAAFGKYGGRFLVRGGQREVVEGKVRGRIVVLEFPSYRAALDCYRSPEYEAAAALRKGKAEFDLFIIEGCDAQILAQGAAAEPEVERKRERWSGALLSFASPPRYTRRPNWPERSHVRHAADRGWGRRTHGAHARPCYCGHGRSNPGGRGGGGLLGGHRPRRGRARRAGPERRGGD